MDEKKYALTLRSGNPAYFGLPNCRGSTRPWFEVPNHLGPAQPGPGMGFITPYTANPKGRFGGDLGRNDIRKILRGARGDRIGRMPRHPHPSNIVNAGHGSWSPEYPDESEIDDIDEDTWDTTSMVSSDSGSWERYPPEAAVNGGLLGPTYGPDRRLHGRSGSSRRRLQWDDEPFYENRGGIARVPGRSGRDPHRTGAYRSRSMGSGDWATDGGY